MSISSNGFIPQYGTIQVSDYSIAVIASDRQIQENTKHRSATAL